MQTLSPGLTIYFGLLAAALGACMGSFLNCMAWRILHGESVLRGRSHCDACGHELGLLDLFPLVSFLASRGRCRYCGARLSRLHLAAELTGALLFLAFFLRYGVSLQALECVLLGCVLLGCALGDLEGYIIPDRLIIAGLVIRLCFVFVGPEPVSRLLDGLIGGVGGAGVVLLLALYLERRIGREAVGGGDIKLLFLTGLSLGWMRSILCLLLAALVGIVFGMATAKRRRGQEDARAFPWGPSIAAAWLLTALAGREVISWYLGLF